MGLDGVEIVIAWEDAFGISIRDEEARTLLTPRMATDLIWRMLGSAVVPARGDVCLSLRAFMRVRGALVAGLGCPRGMVRPGTRMWEFYAREGSRERWRRLPSLSGMRKFPQLWLVPALTLRTKTVADVVADFVALQPRSLVPEGFPWSRQRVRMVVRAVIRHQQGIREFSDDDEFVRDLGID